MSFPQGFGNAIGFPYVPLDGSRAMTGDLTLGSTNKVIWGTRGSLSASADGQHLFLNNAGTGYTRLALGGTSSSFPALRANSNQLQADLADGSALCAMIAQNFQAGAATATFYEAAMIEAVSGWVLNWSNSSTNGASTKDVGIARDAAGVLKITNGSSGNGDLKLLPSALTAGTMTVTNSALDRVALHRFDWTNAMITALGAGGAGDISVCVLPAKTVVLNAYVVINTPDSSANALTVAVGRTSASYIDYIVASDAKAAANTVYGDASGERGTNLTGYDLPSYTGTTTVNAHFIKTTTGLNTVTGSTGSVFLLTYTLP